MNVEVFLDACIAQGVSISMAGENLRVTRSDHTPAVLIEQIKERKPELIAWLNRAGQDDHGANRIGRADRSAGQFPLSYSQSRLWFVDRLERSWQYNIHEQLRFRGPLQQAAVERAVNAIVARHEVLRTTFIEIDGVPYQRVHAERHVAVPVVALDSLPRAQAEADIARLATRDAHQVFDLERDCMLRATLIGVAPDEHVLLFTAHHIAADGMSMAVLVREFMALYEADVAGRPDGLPALALQYIDYASWQRSAGQDRQFAQALERALVRLDGIPRLHALPLDAIRPASQAYSGDTLRSTLDPALQARLHTLCRTHGVTLFMLLQAAYGLLIGRWSNEDDVVVGSPTAGRTHSELQGLCGFFLNNIVLRNRLRTGSFLDYLAAAKEDALAAISDQFLPFDKLVEAANPERSMSYSPLFQLVFVLQNTDSAHLALDGIDVTSASRHAIKFDLELSARETADGIALEWIYADTLFQPDTVARLATSFAVLLDGIVAAPGMDIFALPLVPAPDLALLAQWSRGPDAPHGEASVYGLFAAQAQATPDAVAIRSGAVTLSYAELHARSSRLAALLREEGIAAGSRVGICLARSPAQVIGVLGVLAAGAAYVPLEPGHPQDLLDWMVADAALELVLIESSLLGNLALGGIDVTLMDDALAPDWLAGFAGDAPPLPLAAPDQPMYVLYTSGSTGRPKGVMVPQRGVLNYLRHGVAAYRMEAHAGAVVGTPLAFDATLTTLFLPLLCGKALHLLPEAQADMLAGLAGLLFGSAAPLLFKLTPAHLDLLETLAADRPNAPPVAHTLVVGGEQFTVASARRWKEDLLPAACFVNEYGPTETVVGCTVFQIADGAGLARLAGSAAVPIGRPIANTTLAVLNARQLPCPVGAIGELYIGGAGVAQGYLNQPALSGERFVGLPGAGMPDVRWYRSGDLVRYLADDELAFIGRADQQVKVRGYRIELGAIEATLDGHAAVRKSAVVVDAAPGGQRLLAFVVADGDHCGDLPAWLRARLPAYMLPDVVQAVPALPLTVNGKLDVPALLAMLAAPVAENDAPRSATEERLRDIWADLLGHDGIAMTANFFALGGHSLLAARMVSAIRDQFDCAFLLKDVFELRTIRDMALHADFLVGGQGSAAVEDSKQEELEW